MWVTVAKRKDRPGWWVMINYRGQRKKISFGADKEKAKACAARFLAKFALAKVTGEPVVVSQPDQAMPTVQGYTEEWLEVYAKVHCQPSTFESYQQCLKAHVYPAIGGRKLDEITRATVKRLIADLTAKGLKKQTVRNVLTPLKKAYQEALDDCILKANPFVRTGALTRSKEDRRIHIQPLTTQELDAVLSYAQRALPAAYPLFLCAARTGMRQGELIGLKWGDIDFHGQFIEVRRSIVWGKVAPTKTQKIRRVDMTPQLAAVLRQRSEIRQLVAMAKAQPKDGQPNAGEEGKAVEPWVFLSPEGKPWDERNLRRAWYRCLEKAEIRRVRFHDLRHTYASLSLAAGAQPKQIQEQLGHSSIQVTMDIYSHLFSNGNREWVAKLDSPARPVQDAPDMHPDAESASEAAAGYVGKSA